MIRRLILLLAFVILSPSIARADATCSSCIKKCVGSNPLETCLANCKSQGICKDKKAQKEESEEKKTLRTGTLDDSRMKEMSLEELETWKSEYQGRKWNWDDKCIKAKKDDPYYQTIMDKCQEGKSNVQIKLNAIEGEISKKKEERARNQKQERCRQSPSDQDYCQLGCGQCVMYGNGWVPKDRVAQRQAEDDRKREQAEAKKSKGKKGKIVVKETIEIDNCPPGDRTCKALKAGVDNINSGQHQFKEDKDPAEAEMNKLFPKK